MGAIMGSTFGQGGMGNSAMKGGLTGLSKGLQTPQQPPQGLAPPINVPQPPTVDPSMFGMGKPKNPFYGQ